MSFFFPSSNMQLTNGQPVFTVTSWMRSKSLAVVQEKFAQKFPDRSVPSSLNSNQGRSGRKRTATIKVLKHYKRESSS